VDDTTNNDRRAFLASVAGLAVACSSRSSSSRGKPAAAGEGWHDVEFPATNGRDEGRALIYAPDGCKEWPVLVALHGRGEAGRGLRAGAYGWRDDYDLGKALERLKTGSLTSDDAGHLLTAERIAALNASLAAAPFTGLVVACPYTPVPTGRGAGDAAPFARFITESLLPKVAELRGAPVRRENAAIDGVSMGGRYALQIGLGVSSAFSSVGGLQPAIQVAEADTFAEMAVASLEKAPTKIRLVSSEEDPFLEATRALADALGRRSIAHTLVVTKGPHDYVWNQGPGSIEMAIHHERVLRGLPAP
jgi:dienelactone hydrolase